MEKVEDKAEATQTTVTASPQTSIPKSIFSKILHIVSWTPPNCRWDPEKPPKFSMGLNVLFAFASAFTVANLYYNHPILNILARDFNVSDEQSSQIPTLMQAGYACGLFFFCPLGDLLRRRPFVLSLVFFTSTLWIVLCLTTSFTTFSAISFIVAVTTVTPQLMLPLVGDLAPPNRRAAALSIVVSGFILGILIARVLSGTVTNYVSWRNIYWMSCGLQYTIFILLWLFMPDYPSKNPEGLNYFKMLWSILPILCRNPVLVQACLVAFFISATFTSYWTTLTFLLADDPYNYSPLVIGLFGLIGIGSMLFGPVYARLVTDRFVPWFSVFVGVMCCLVGIVVSTYTGTFWIGGPIIQAILNDFGMQIAQVANRTQIYAIEPRARNRVNVAFMLFMFFGQILGTSAGNHVYANGGWIRSGSASVGFICSSLLFCLSRGPWETGWVGWHGGFGLKKKDKSSADGRTVETTFYQTERRATNIDVEATAGDENMGMEDNASTGDKSIEEKLTLKPEDVSNAEVREKSSVEKALEEMAAE